MGRGRSKGGKTDEMNVPYDKWGRVITDSEPKYLKDADGNYTGFIIDEEEWNNEPYVEKVTKAKLLKDIEYYNNGDGTYGGDDDAIYVAYDDGRLIDLTELEKGEKWSKRGIVGLSISNGYDAEVWGGEMQLRNPSRSDYGTLRQWTTPVFDENAEIVSEHSNSYVGYRSTKKRRVRTQYSYHEPRQTKNENDYLLRRYYPKKIIRRSTWADK